MERVELGRLLGGRPTGQTARRVLISEAESRKFMAAFAQAVAGDAEVFLCDPKWGAGERAKVDAMLSTAPSPSANPDEGWLMIPTGGSSGRLRFARHDGRTLVAAVRGFTAHFGASQINAVGVLPLHHVSGLLAWMRCVLTGGVYRPIDWKAIEAGELPALPVKVHGWTISLVATQLDRLLRQPAAVEWLKKFRCIFVGGGPTWPEVLDRAAADGLPVSLGYGMTESAAMVTALRAEDFLAGGRSSGTALPHATVRINADGVITLGGDSLFRGYYPQWRAPGDFTTEDGGVLDKAGRLSVTGRRDSVIISGGEKVDPMEVEAALRSSGELPDVVVLGVPDEEWGLVVIAAYPAAAEPKLKKVAEVMNRLLSPAKRPKIFVPLAVWPVNDQGKVNRPQATRLAELALRTGLGANER